MYKKIVLKFRQNPKHYGQNPKHYGQNGKH